MAAALGIDLGGTELRVAVVDRGGAVLAVRIEPTAVRAGPAGVVDQIAAMAAAVRAEAPDAAPGGAGIGAPGPLDPAAGTVFNTTTLPGWDAVPIARLLEERLRLPVRLENDANAAALGEWRFGAGRGLASLVFVTVSTGIGGGVVADGRLLQGHRGLAGEIGHMTIDCERAGWFGPPGTWEAFASGSALGARASQETASGDGSMLRSLSGEGPVTARHVVEAARAGDPQATRLLDDEARWLGVGFANLLHLYSPEAIIVGGGVAAGLDLMRGTVETVMRGRALPAFRDVPVLAAALGRHAGLVGAASLVLDAPSGQAAGESARP